MRRCVLSVLVLCSWCAVSANVRADSVAFTMVDFLMESLRDNYGEKADDQLFIDFFSDYIRTKGEMSLKIDKRRLELINRTVLDDSVYYRYYPLLFFIGNDADSEKAKNYSAMIPVLAFNEPKNKRDYKASRFFIYLNSKYLSSVNVDPNNIAIKNILDYKDGTGAISYDVVADSFLVCPKCLRGEMINEFLAVIFWKYLCDQADFDFYKMK